MYIEYMPRPKWATGLLDCEWNHLKETKMTTLTKFRKEVQDYQIKAGWPCPQCRLIARTVFADLDKMEAAGAKLNT